MNSVWIHQRCPWVLCDFLDELALCSWRNFGRTATAGKVHFCAEFFFSFLFYLEVMALTMDHWSPRIYFSLGIVCYWVRPFNQPHAVEKVLFKH